MTRTYRYTIPTLIMHWTFAAIIVPYFFIGKAFATTSPSPEKLKLFFLYNSLGGVLAFLLLIRFVLLVTQKRPEADPTWSLFITQLSIILQVFLYSASLVMIVSGLWVTISEGLLTLAFAGNWQAWPAKLQTPLAQVHCTAANILAVTVILHVLGVGFHQFIMKDNLISRMLPGTPFTQ